MRIDLIRDAIKGAGLVSNVRPTQTNLARLLGISPVQVCKWLKRKTKPSQYLRVSVYDLARFWESFTKHRENLKKILEERK